MVATSDRISIQEAKALLSELRHCFEGMNNENWYQMRNVWIL
jgi:hypothetical protein